MVESRNFGMSEEDQEAMIQDLNNADRELKDAESKLKITTSEKDLQNKVLDEELESMTGRILQGMSPEQAYLEIEKENSTLDRVLERIRAIHDLTEELTGVTVIANQALAGFDSNKAWEIRNEIIDRGGTSDDLLYSLAGIDSDKAWEIRDAYVIEIDSWNSEKSFANSLIGLNSERSWKAREKIKYDQLLIESIAGLEDQRAWDFRNISTAIERMPNTIADSLIGLDSKSAWKMREKLIKHPGVFCVGKSLKGLDSKEAWGVRKVFNSYTEDLSELRILLESLQGLDTPEAWKIRDEAYQKLSTRSDSYATSAISEFLYSIAGINSERAKKLRDTLVSEIPTEDGGLYTQMRAIAVYSESGGVDGMIINRNRALKK